MTARSLTLSLALAPLLAAATAHAQAPGQVAPIDPDAPYGTGSTYAPYAPYAPEDPVVAPVAPVAPQFQHRLGIGASFGFLQVDAAQFGGGVTEFDIGELAIRYRASRRIELELSMSGGREQLPDGGNGQLATGSVALAARYRFRPEQPWGWWLMGGLGGSVVERSDSTSDERDAATRALGMAGIGVERRFTHFALQAELRAVAMGSRKDARQVKADPPFAPAGAPVPLYAPGNVTYAEELAGTMLTFGASYYF